MWCTHRGGHSDGRFGIAKAEQINEWSDDDWAWAHHGSDAAEVFFALVIDFSLKLMPAPCKGNCNGKGRGKAKKNKLKSAALLVA